MNLAVAFKYCEESRQFILSTHDVDRIRFGDFALNFRMTSLSMRQGRVHPTFDSAGNDYPVRLWGMGSSAYLMKAEAAGRIRLQQIGDAVMLSYANDVKEAVFSPDHAVSITMTELPDVSRGVFFQNRSNECRKWDQEGLWWSQAAFVDDLTCQLQHDWGLLAC